MINQKMISKKMANICDAVSEAIWILPLILSLTGG
jgi:hypothetical protein